jgi:hypothetical protein
MQLNQAGKKYSFDKLKIYDYDIHFSKLNFLCELQSNSHTRK